MTLAGAGWFLGRLLVLVLAAVLDLITVILRFVVGAWAGRLAGELLWSGSGGGWGSLAGGVLFGFGPFLFALVAFAGLPGGGLLSRHLYGARPPSQTEAERIEAVLARFAGRPSVRLPRRIYVVDHGGAGGAGVLGTTLYVDRELLERPEYLPGVLAHEVAHLTHGDGAFALALGRLRLPIPVPGGRGLGVLFALLVLALRGGFGLWVLRPLVDAISRRQERLADQFCVTAGERRSLLAYLSEFAAPRDAAQPWYAGMSHPYVEERIDRLRSSGAGP